MLCPKSVVTQFAVATTYEEPNSCENILKTTTITFTGSSPITPSSTSDWEDFDSEKSVSFNRGACPSGWTYNAVARWLSVEIAQSGSPSACTEQRTDY
ncbi:hypothetical protein FPOAC1_006369 [Fusarium poae]|uniref:hypothetical protein n=1 Tax=Fusarium poae TaxID=36050 RepID=UPI001CEBD2C5|nr:hypothetical protein FPOAC1_006369 [Fusarium poae]KAG8673066.1 hypothetical protein FPOAC1_006369 [Fusarium poae]